MKSLVKLVFYNLVLTVQWLYKTLFTTQSSKGIKKTLENI